MIAVDKLVAALAARGDLERTREAFAEDATLRRFGWTEGRREFVAELFSGIAEINGWLGRTPAEVEIRAVGEAEAEGEGWRVRYLVVFGDYRNEGTWDLSLDEGGKIQTLDHRPDDLPGEWRTGIPEGKRLPEGRAEPRAHDHDHRHRG